MTSPIRTYTLSDLQALQPCDAYRDDDWALLRRLVGDGVDRDQIASAPIAWQDRVWVLVRLMPEAAVPRYAADCAESVLHKARDQDRDACRRAIAAARSEPIDRREAAGAADRAAGAADRAAARAAARAARAAARAAAGPADRAAAAAADAAGAAAWAAWAAGAAFGAAAWAAWAAEAAARAAGAAEAAARAAEAADRAARAAWAAGAGASSDDMVRLALRYVP